MLRLVAVALALLSLGWGLAHGVRAVAAFGGAWTAVLALLWYWPRRAARGIELERRMSPVVCEEDEIPVSFRLSNTSQLPLLAPEIVDRFPPDRIDPRRAFVYPLLPGRRVARADYRGRSHGRRGPYRIGPARVRLSDPTGMFFAEWSEEASAGLIVFPALETVDPPEVASRGRAPSFGGRSRREAGEGDLLLGVREYRAGDALRRIHWPTTARRGRLSIIEYERQLARRVTLVVDLSRQSLRGLGRQATVEVALRTAAAVGAACLRRGDRVGFLGDDGGRVEVPAGRGDGQLVRILERLALLKAEGQRPLSALLEQEAPEFVAGQMVVVVVSDVEEDGAALLEPLELCVERGCQVVAALLDPATFPRIYEREPDAGRLELADMAEACLRRGITPYAVRAAEPLRDAFLTPWFGRRKLRITSAQLGAQT